MSHHTLLIVDLSEKLEPMYNELSDDQKHDLRVGSRIRGPLKDLTVQERDDLRIYEAFLDDTAKHIVEHSKKYGVRAILEHLEGTACRRSLVRAALRQLIREDAAELAEAVA